MRSTNTGPVDRMAGGAFQQSLDLPAATVAEESGEPSPGMLTSAGAGNVVRDRAPDLEG